MPLDTYRKIGVILVSYRKIAVHLDNYRKSGVLLDSYRKLLPTVSGPWLHGTSYVSLCAALHTCLREAITGKILGSFDIV